VTAVEIIRHRREKPLVTAPDGRVLLCGGVLTAGLVAKELGVNPAPVRWVTEREYRDLRSRAE